MLNFATVPEAVTKAVCERIQTHFEANLEISFFFEGASVEGLGPNTVEVRLDGPDITEIAMNQFHIVVHVDMLVTLETGTNIYTKPKIHGVCLESLNDDIPLFLDNVQVGCLTKAIPFGGNEKIVIAERGQVNKDRKVTHSTVSTTFHMLM